MSWSSTHGKRYIAIITAMNCNLSEATKKKSLNEQRQTVPLPAATAINSFNNIATKLCSDFKKETLLWPHYCVMMKTDCSPQITWQVLHSFATQFSQPSDCPSSCCANEQSPWAEINGQRLARLFSPLLIGTKPEPRTPVCKLVFSCRDFEDQCSEFSKATVAQSGKTWRKWAMCERGRFLPTRRPRIVSENWRKIPLVLIAQRSHEAGHRSVTSPIAAAFLTACPPTNNEIEINSTGRRQSGVCERIIFGG